MLLLLLRLMLTGAGGAHGGDGAEGAGRSGDGRRRRRRVGPLHAQRRLQFDGEFVQFVFIIDDFQIGQIRPDFTRHLRLFVDLLGADHDGVAFGRRAASQRRHPIHGAVSAAAADAVEAAAAVRGGGGGGVVDVVVHSLGVVFGGAHVAHVTDFFSQHAEFFKVDEAFDFGVVAEADEG